MRPVDEWIRGDRQAGPIRQEVNPVDQDSFQGRKAQAKLAPASLFVSTSAESPEPYAVGGA